MVMQEEGLPLHDVECARLACYSVYRASDELDGLLKDKYEVLETHLMDSKFDVHASSYLIVRPLDSLKRVFVVFRGTQDLSDMIADFNCQPREIDEADDDDGNHPLFVHGGIYETSKQSMKNIAACLNRAHQKRGIEEIFFTGHSLGGACAMAARLVSLQHAGAKTGSPDRSARHLQFAPSFHIVTFGAPLLFSHGSGKADAEDGDVAALLLRRPLLQRIQVGKTHTIWSR
jgi:hypothetical protein